MKLVQSNTKNSPITLNVSKLSHNLLVLWNQNNHLTQSTIMQR